MAIDALRVQSELFKMNQWDDIELRARETIQD